MFPPRDLIALLNLGRFLEHHSEPGLLLGPDGEQVPLPEEVYQVLVEVVDAMREGKAITLVPRTQRLGIDPGKRFAGIREAFNDSLITGWEDLEGGLSLPITRGQLQS